MRGEVLGAAVLEHPGDAARDVRVAQRLRRLIEKRRCCGDVEAGRVAVARERGVAPFAVELVGAEHERAVDGGALGAVGGARVAVLEPASARVAVGQLDPGAAIELDGQRPVAGPGQRAASRR